MPSEDWELLENEPEKFFGLEEGYDRKQLKRSYNRLLRQYKPEKYPDEFQKIRAAYEGLEQLLRYKDASPYGENSVWQMPSDSVSETDQPEQKEQRAVVDDYVVPADPLSFEAIVQRIKTGDEEVADLYAELKARKHKNEPDYYALALLSDTVEVDDPHSFLRWILEGLKKTPLDHGLGALAYQYLNHQVADASLAKVLLSCSKVIGCDQFFAITDGAWDRLMRLIPFDRVIELLDSCEANLDAGDAKISSRLSFYLHTLRYAIWKDESNWTEEKFQYLQEHFDQISPQLESDLDLLGLVRDYHAKRKGFVESHPLRKQMDQILESVFTKDPLESDQAMIAFQRIVLLDQDEIIDAFALSEIDELIEGGAEFFALWNWVSHESASRLTVQDESEIDYQFWGERMQNWLTAIVFKQPFVAQWRDAMELFYKLAKYGAVLVAGITCFAASSFLGALLADYVIEGVDKGDELVLIAVVSTLVAVLGSIFFYRWWNPYLTDKIWMPYRNGMNLKTYKKSWQQKCLDYLKRSKLKYFDFRGMIAQMSLTNQNADASWINHFVNDDLSLAMYSVACLFEE